MSRHSATPALLSLALAIPLCAQSEDTILRKTGAPLTKVTINKLGHDKITYTKAGKEETIDRSLVLGYRFGSAPEAFTRGMSAANRGSYESAAKLFEEAAKATKNDAVKTTAVFYSGRSFALAAAKDASHANNAVRQLQDYLSAEANGYYLAEAKVRLAQASLAGKDAAGAETMLTALESEASSGAWPMFWVALVKFTKAEAQFKLGNFSAARSTYMQVDGAVTTALGEDPSHGAELQRIKTEALIQQGETYIGEKAYADAMRYFQGLKTSTARGVKAAAEAGQGQILFIQSEGSKDLTKLRQAQLALARACIEPDTSDSTSAKALYYMGKVLNALGDKEENALGRAKTYFQSVKNTYGATEWAAKARKELEG